MGPNDLQSWISQHQSKTARPVLLPRTTQANVLTVPGISNPHCWDWGKQVLAKIVRQCLVVVCKLTRWYPDGSYSINSSSHQNHFDGSVAASVLYKGVDYHTDDCHWGISYPPVSRNLWPSPYAKCTGHSPRCCGFNVHCQATLNSRKTHRGVMCAWVRGQRVNAAIQYNPVYKYTISLHPSSAVTLPRLPW